MDLFLDVHQVEQMDQFWGIWWPREALARTGESIVEDARLRLEDDETAPDGSRWAPWSRDYAKTRGPGHKLLFSEGTLAKSLDAQFRGDEVDVGSPLDYALVHQEGSKDGTTEARPYVGVSNELEQALNETLASDFDGGWSAMRV